MAERGSSTRRLETVRAGRKAAGGSRKRGYLHSVTDALRVRDERAAGCAEAPESQPPAE